MQIKTTMSYHLTSINGYYQKKEKKKKQEISVGKEVEKQEL